MSDRDKLKARLQVTESALDKIETEYNKGMIDMGRYLQLKTEYETRKVELEQELNSISHGQQTLAAPERLREKTTPASDRAKLRQYQDFELTVVAAQSPNTYLVTARSASGRASAQATLDPASDEWRTALDAIERKDTNEAFFYKLGTQLFEALFPNGVENVYRSSQGYVKGKGKGLRIRLCLDQAPEIAALPWEYLYDSQRDIFLGISNDTPISRFIEPQQIFPPPPPPKGKLRLLTVISNPKDLEEYGFSSLDAEAELKTLEKALQRLKDQDLLEQIEPLHAVRADISEALRTHHPHVLHFIGHGVFEGGRGKLIIEDEDHYYLEMRDRAFRELLEGYPDTRLVVLNACQGASRAAGDAMVGMGPQLVSRSVPAVVAMQHTVYDRAAISFTREFYRALSHWYPIDVAISEARRAIYLDYGLDRRDWGSPVLFMRDKEGILFQRPAVAAALPSTRQKSETPSRQKVPKQTIDQAKLQQLLDTFVIENVGGYETPRLKNGGKLHAILTNGFSSEELKNLCYDMGIDYATLPAQGTSGQARELITHCIRRNRIHELVETAYRRQPQANW